MNPSVFRALRYGASFLLLLSLFPIRLPADALDLGRLEADYQRSDQFSKSAFRTSVSQEDLEQQLIPYLRSGQLKRHISKNVGNGDTRFGTRLKQLLALQRVKGPSTVFSALQVLEAPIHTRRVSLRLTPYGPPGPLLDALARQGGRGEWVPVLQTVLAELPASAVETFLQQQRSALTHADLDQRVQPFSAMLEKDWP